jgi:hypothetical protein
MPAIGLAEAARLTGRNQSTIHRAMKAGRLSYTKNEAGERRVEVTELERTFGIPAIKDRGNGASLGNDAGNRASHDTQGSDSVSRNELQRVLDERERMIAAHEATIRDLRARLDSEVDERRRLLALLTDQRLRPWWRRWFR